MESEITKNVKNFYDDQPFNYYGSLTDADSHIKKNPIRAYPDLNRILSLKKTKLLMEFGCGTGWFANASAYHYSKPVTAVDLSAAAIKRAKEMPRFSASAKISPLSSRTYSIFIPQILLILWLVSVFCIIPATPGTRLSISRNSS